MRHLTLVLFAASAFAGESLNLANRNASGSLGAAPSKSSPWRAELYLHDLDLSVSRTLAEPGAYGLQINSIGGGTLNIQTYFWNDGESGNCQFAPGGDVYLRVQRDPVARTVTCEAWNPSGVRIYNSLVTFASNTAGAAGTEIFVGGYSPGASAASVAFLRMHSTLVPVNSRPPVTFDNANRLHEWKFDNSLTDEVGGVTLTSGGGSAVYVSTPNQGNYSRPKVNATTWSDWTSLRAGESATLTGSDSYSQADDSNTVTPLWQQLSGPSRLVFSSQTTLNPVVSGALPGAYTFQLTVTGTSGAPGVATIEAGAIPTDNNGVVANSAVAQEIFGPMIGFGRNPWGYADDTALRAVTVRGVAEYETLYTKDWLDYKQGTVSYNAGGNSGSLTTLSTGINATDTSIVVASTANLTLSSFPTIIQFGYNGERVLICSAAGTTLTVCPDGRGWANSTAGSRSAGAAIIQPIAVGDGTAFLADYCGGRIGPFVGSGLYTTGTVSATAGSTTLTGSGTTWTGNVFAGMTVKFTGTISAVPFEFITTVASVGGNTSITLSRAYPASAGNVSGITYQIFNANQKWTPRWERPDETNGHIRYDDPACISNTQLAFYGGLEAWTGAQTGRQHSTSRQNWMTQMGNGTPNFYDEVAAHYAMYLRSGSPAALAAARWLGDVWATSPELDEGWGFGPGIPRNVGALGILASWQIDGRDWHYTIRKLAKNAQAILAAQGTNCLVGDLREDAYSYSWIAMAAEYDPDAGERAAFAASLETLLTREQACQDSVTGYYPSYGYYNFNEPFVSFTNGSTAGTGTGLSNANICNSVSTGSATATANSATITGTSLPAPSGDQAISITGLRDGQPFSWQGRWSGSGSSITLSGLWAGSSGTITYIVHGDRNHTMFSAAVGDTTFNQANPCIWNSSTSITLAKPWAGATGSFGWYRGNIIGAGVQPFMAGIKALEYVFARNATSGATQTAYNNLAVGIANWIKNEGYDPRSKGLYYGRGFGICEPPVDAPGYNPTTLTSSPEFDWSISECQFGFGAGAVGAARAQNAEVGNAMRVIYEAAPTTPNREFGDSFYGSLWGRAGFTEAGFPSDDGFTNTYGFDSALDDGKWYGFQFGVGMAHQWPAVRVGGLAPADPVTVGMAVAALSGETGAPSVIYTSATAATETVLCTAGTSGWYCPGAGDRRLGTEILAQVVRQMPGGELRGERRPVRIK